MQCGLNGWYNHNIILTGTMGVRVQGLKFTSSVKHMEIFSNPSGPTQKVYIADVDKIRARQLPDGMSINISSLNVSYWKPVDSVFA